VFPSLYEGFGFPVLEALLTRTPVITSTTSSLPELAGDAALLVDPLDVDAIVNALACVVDNPNLLITLRERGVEQARKFNWDAAAAAALDALEAAAR
ncbi:MAG: glycosyltransferase family 4 protein, partial [Chloroflexi bacterium]|nr:glycosyltransferase family 4 protein [Chloroflexota bacterium]